LLLGAGGRMVVWEGRGGKVKRRGGKVMKQFSM
jgi:hypothetical protein